LQVITAGHQVARNAVYGSICITLLSGISPRSSEKQLALAYSYCHTSNMNSRQSHFRAVRHCLLVSMIMLLIYRQFCFGAEALCAELHGAGESAATDIAGSDTRSIVAIE
jgi:hypothetical protein